MTMAFTREQHQALQEAIANGALTVDFNGRRVTYRSLDEMMRILSLMERDLGGNQVPNDRRRYASFSKGH
ncbi:MAG TPA: hypothetical protein VIM34_12210 [Burkholderiaceae bacterium]|jgi:hypothetical protein